MATVSTGLAEDDSTMTMDDGATGDAVEKLGKAPPTFATPGPLVEVATAVDKIEDEFAGLRNGRFLRLPPIGTKNINVRRSDAACLSDNAVHVCESDSHNLSPWIRAHDSSWIAPFAIALCGTSTISLVALSTSRSCEAFSYEPEEERQQEDRSSQCVPRHSCLMTRENAGSNIYK